MEFKITGPDWLELKESTENQIKIATVQLIMLNNNLKFIDNELKKHKLPKLKK